MALEFRFHAISANLLDRGVHCGIEAHELRLCLGPAVSLPLLARRKGRGRRETFDSPEALREIGIARVVIPLPAGGPGGITRGLEKIANEVIDRL
jgi:hypothetical protein